MFDDTKETCTNILCKKENPEEGFKMIPFCAEDSGPHWYQVTGNVVTNPLVTKNLPLFFQRFPIHCKPKTEKDVEGILNGEIKNFVGDLIDDDYDNLEEFCSPKHLEIGDEVKMSNSLPSNHTVPTVQVDDESDLGSSLHINMKLALRKDMDKKNLYPKKLKYRAVKLISPPKQDRDLIPEEDLLQPGKDIIFRVRVYRLFQYIEKGKTKNRNAVLNSDIILVGRQYLSALRDRIVCLNDICTSVDVSEAPDDLPSASAKELFPSGFLFINNVFYVDQRSGCVDYTVTIREWAANRGLGNFLVQDMSKVKLQDIVLKLGHPDVYIHQGNCEHLLTFSEVRLLHSSDPLDLSLYPYHTQAAQSQTIYCSTCGEIGSKWIITDCEQVPFDPTCFCEICFRQYLYKDGKKTCDFKAFVYKVNQINIYKPFK